MLALGPPQLRDITRELLGCSGPGVVRNLEFAPLLETYHTICRSASILEQYYWMVPWPQMAHRTPAGPLAVRAFKRVFDAAMKLHDSLDAESQHIGAGEASQAAAVDNGAE